MSVNKRMTVARNSTASSIDGPHISHSTSVVADTASVAAVRTRSSRSCIFLARVCVCISVSVHADVCVWEVPEMAANTIEQRNAVVKRSGISGPLAPFFPSQTLQPSRRVQFVSLFVLVSQFCLWRFTHTATSRPCKLEVNVATA